MRAGKRQLLKCAVESMKVKGPPLGSIHGYTVACVWLLVLGLALPGWTQRQENEAVPPPKSNADFRAATKQFSDVYRIVEKSYANRVNPDVAIYGPSGSNAVGAISGMLRTLDPHSDFFDPTSYAALRQQMEGDYYGVGMEIDARPEKMGKVVTEVVEPLPGSPAFGAGLRPGDIISAVDGRSTMNMDSNQVADLLRGPEGTRVTVSVLRKGLSHPLEVTLAREKITQLSVDSAFMIRPGIAYIHIQTFNNELTNQQLSSALNRLGENNFKGLILDLRGNGGGLLEQAVEVTSHFLRTNQLVVYHYGRSSPIERYYVTQGEEGSEYPMIVLINGNTASAAEIVTGALQDHDRALVVGQRSFGKGLVQSEFPLSDQTMLLLTTAHYYTPSGRLIQRDYSDISLYDYYYHYDPAPLPHTQARLTDGGRVVYGGGGIRPDVTVSSVKPNSTEQKLSDAGVFLDFGKTYLATHPTVPRDFKPDRKVLDEFKTFLTSNGITLSPQAFGANESFIREHIQTQIVESIHGVEAAKEIAVTHDPLVLRSLNDFGQAHALLIRARRYMASRGEQSSNF
jgi:carboxyl-terminal processing protease